MAIHYHFRRQAPDDCFSHPIMVRLDQILQRFATGAHQMSSAKYSQRFMTIAPKPCRLAGVNQA
jgi:hypothetical protein